MSWNNFKTPNIGLLVYKRLYSEPDVRDKIQVNSHEGKLEINIPKDAKTTPFDPFYKCIYDSKQTDWSLIENPYAVPKFNLVTTYPGLLLGTGYTHDSNAKGDIKIGFFFDHTSGQPIIPGSSIKGVLKSVFENEEDETDIDSVHNIRFFIREILKKCVDDEKYEWQNLLNKIKEYGVEMIRNLKEDIFGNQDNEGKDVFFDAVIDFAEIDNSKEFLSNDFITPHPDPLKNPNPLMFLKVLPNVVFSFRFDLNNSFVLPEFNIANKIKLFQKILLTIGIGAKTNVGYGQFEEPQSIGLKKNTNSPIQHLQLNKGIVASAIKTGDVLEAEIVNLSGGITIDLHIKDISFKPRLLGVSSSGYKLKQIIKVKVVQIGKLMKFSLTE